MPQSIPSHVAVVAARIAQFDSLSSADRLRAAALALKRDFNVDDANLKLAARKVGDGSDERVLIAYTTQSQRADDTVDARWFDAAKSDAIYWLGAPNGVALSNAGAVAIEHWSMSEGVPAPIMALVAQSVGARSASRKRLVIDDAANLINERTLDLWRASLGIAIERGALPDAAQPIALLPPPAAAVSARRGALDRALFACACAAALAALLSIVRYATLPSVDVVRAVASGANTASGELWASATRAAPALTDEMKTASYGGGAWVIAAPTLERTALPAIANALSANGLAVQTIIEPEPRIRVQKP